MAVHDDAAAAIATAIANVICCVAWYFAALHFKLLCMRALPSSPTKNRLPVAAHLHCFLPTSMLFWRLSQTQLGTVISRGEMGLTHQQESDKNQSFRRSVGQNAFNFDFMHSGRHFPLSPGQCYDQPKSSIVVSVQSLCEWCRFLQCRFCWFVRTSVPVSL